MTWAPGDPVYRRPNPNDSGVQIVRQILQLIEDDDLSSGLIGTYPNRAFPTPWPWLTPSKEVPNARQ